VTSTDSPLTGASGNPLTLWRIIQSKHYVRQRREATSNLAKSTDQEFLAVADSNVLDRLISIHRERVAICVHLEDQISKLESRINTITEAAATESCLRMTGYKGLRDWASDAWAAYRNLVQALLTICFVGAGLTYTSIFSATRGDIGLMAWAFSLFLLGMVVAVAIQAILVQCARLEDYPFTSQRLWEVVLGVFVYSACLAVAIATCLLLLTVFRLQFIETKGDALLTFEFSPRPPAVLALCVIAISIVVGIVILGVFVVAYGTTPLIRRRKLLRKEIEKSQDDLA